MDDTELLIDFNSPVSKCSYQTPLIPIRKINPIEESVSPTFSNPFDTVAKQASPPKDPFESAFKSAFDYPGEIRESTPVSKKDSGGSGTCEVFEVPASSADEAVIKLQQNPTKGISVSQEKETKQTSNEDDKIIDEDGDHHSLLSADFSSEDGLRNFIANRVKHCIQKALNSSGTARISKSNDSVWSAKDGTDAKFTYNRRSLSFVLPSSTCPNKCDKLNNSCSDSMGDGKCFLSNGIQLNNAANRPQNSSFLNSAHDELSNMEDSAFDLPEEEHIFHEANKIAQIISNSCCKIADSDNDDNWLSARPQWFDATGSDDEEERLLRDPALNVRVSLVKSMNRSSGDTDSQALSAYKARRNRSLGSDQIDATAQEEFKINVNILKPTASMSSLPTVPVSAILVKPDENIRLKKKSGVDAKRGPMRAVMPIQSMTKETLPVSGKMKINRDTSPIRRPNPAPLEVTPQKNPELSEMRPVASSTPTRREEAAASTQLITPIVNTHHRHSTGSTVQGHKSRPSEVEVRARLRTAISGSNIPTVASAQLAPKAIPTLRSVPRSTSSLPRHSPQIKPALNTNVDQKSKTLKPSYNPRALSDVKSSSPRRGLVKSAVTTISGLVSGKSKKRSIGDKENKVPVRLQ